jgi:hypothetical protein
VFFGVNPKFHRTLDERHFVAIFSANYRACNYALNRRIASAMSGIILGRQKVVSEVVDIAVT